MTILKCKVGYFHAKAKIDKKGCDLLQRITCIQYWLSWAYSNLKYNNVNLIRILITRYF